MRACQTALLLSAAAVLAALPALAHRASTDVISPRQSFNFDQGWKMKTGDDAQASTVAFDDRAWTKVTLPHAFNEEEAFAKDIHELSTGIT